MGYLNRRNRKGIAQCAKSPKKQSVGVYFRQYDFIQLLQFFPFHVKIINTWRWPDCPSPIILKMYFFSVAASGDLF